MYRLENWSVTMANPFGAPETGGSMHGKVYGHPRFDDGDKVTTSKIKDVDTSTGGHVVITHSGSRYLLGEPNPDYIKWLEENGHDPEKPFPYFIEEAGIDIFEGWDA